MKVIVTGASGILGTAVYGAFKSAGHTVLGLARSRPTEELQSLDLLEADATEKVFAEFKPGCKCRYAPCGHSILFT